MDCTNARLLLSFLRTGELDGAERAALDGHLDTCPDCAAAVSCERRFDDAVAHAMQQVAVPAALPQRITQRLSQARRPRPWGWVAAAASVLLAAGLGAYFAWPRPVEFEPGFLVNAHETDFEKVQEYFADLGVDMAPPSQFLSQYLDRYDTAMVQGRRVAHLLFHYPGNGQQRSALAHVYVLPRQHFAPPDANRWPDNLPIPTSSHMLQMIHGEDYIYVILFTGGSLHVFQGSGV